MGSLVHYIIVYHKQVIEVWMVIIFSEPFCTVENILQCESSKIISLTAHTFYCIKVSDYLPNQEIVLITQKYYTSPGRNYNFSHKFHIWLYSYEQNYLLNTLQIISFYYYCSDL